MAYRFNNGNGAVTCEKCHVIIDANLGYKEYEEIYKDKISEYCIKCRNEIKGIIKDLMDDGWRN